MKIMASGSITSRQIDGETVDDFIFVGSKITAEGDCSNDQPRKRIEKQRHYFANKVRLVKAMVFPLVMYGCDSDYKES